GLVEGFVGWGGEDNAWMHKAGLLGRTGTTARRDLHVIHLHHAGSGGVPGSRPGAENPHYSANVERWQRVAAIRDPVRLAREVPARLPDVAAERFDRSAPVTTGGDSTLPVWTYWEGECPEWIRACRRTIARHAPGARFLGPRGFEALRDRDRALDLSRLGPAQ